jgi:hypothetical protein
MFEQVLTCFFGFPGSVLEALVVLLSILAVLAILVGRAMLIVVVRSIGLAWVCLLQWRPV